MTQEKLRAWLGSQLERTGLSAREAAVRADLSHSVLNRILDPDNTVKTGVAACLKLARLFGSDPSVVLEVAEILPAKPPETQEMRNLVHIYQRLPVDKRAELLRYARFLGEQ